MSFLSFSFGLFLLVSVVLYWSVPRALRKGLLLVLSLLFYAWAYPPHAALIVGVMMVVYALSLRVQDPGRVGRAVFLFGIVLCVGVLGYFKYARLLVQTVTDLGGPALHAPDVRIPLGISFFTFEFIHYLVDLRQGRIARPGGVVDFSLFTLFFPTLLSGPIKRYQVFLSEGENQGELRREYIAEGLWRMVIGLGKKVILADSMTPFSDRLLTPDQVSGPGLWVAMYAYAVKIYFDFSGYTDLAIGAARLFGYRVPENFDRPYQRHNLSEFWRHWHMSLSSWIRDYLFIPLGGSRVSPVRAAVNLTLVMAICGLWHGASWNFVVWGLWHGLGLAGLRVWQRVSGTWPALLPERVGRWLAVLVTFQFVCLGWVLFAAPSLHAAVVAYQRMFFLAR
jgi:alginate O-acetyltransferase complex protein AlgI